MLGSAGLSWIWTSLPSRQQVGFSSALCVTHSETQAKSATAMWSMFFSRQTAWTQEVEPNHTSAFKTSDHERQGISHIPLVSAQLGFAHCFKRDHFCLSFTFFLDLCNRSWSSKPNTVYKGSESKSFLAFQAISSLLQLLNSTKAVIGNT